MSKLTDAKIRKAKALESDYKLFDGGGLFILIKKNGAKSWRLKYRFNNREKTLSIGTYPDVSLAEARKHRTQAKTLLSNGLDPSQQKQLEKLQAQRDSDNTFKNVTLEWLTKQTHLSEGYQTKILKIFDLHMFKDLGHLSITKITAPILLVTLRKIENANKLETAHKAKMLTGQIFRYAVSTGICENDPTYSLKGVLRKREVEHRAAVTDPTQLGQILRAFYGYQGQVQVQAGLKLAPMLLLRPGELRRGEWSEINFEKETWEIPAEKMKMRQAHIVPLPSQAVEILKELQQWTGQWQYIFPSGRTPRKPMSDNGLLAAIRRMGIAKTELTIHGFRATARTLLDEELGFPVDHIEHQLAHSVKDPTGRAYNRTSHMEGRRKMLQAWADYLDSLRLENKVTFAKFGGG